MPTRYIFVVSVISDPNPGPDRTYLDVIYGMVIPIAVVLIALVPIMAYRHTIVLKYRVWRARKRPPCG